MRCLSKFPVVVLLVFQPCVETNSDSWSMVVKRDVKKTAGRGKFMKIIYEDHLKNMFAAEQYLDWMSAAEANGLLRRI